MVHEIAHQVPDLQRMQKDAHIAMLLQQQAIWERATALLPELSAPPDIHLDHGGMRAKWEFPERNVEDNNGVSLTVRPRAVAELSVSAVTTWLSQVEQLSVPRALAGKGVSPRRIQGFAGTEAGLMRRSYWYNGSGLARHLGAGMLERSGVRLAISTLHTPNEDNGIPEPAAEVVLRHPDMHRLLPRDAMYLDPSHPILHELAAEQPLGGQRDVTVADVQSLLEDHVPTQLPAEYDSWPQVWAGIKPLSAAG